MTNAAERLLRSVDPKKTRGRLETVADARDPVSRQLEQVLEAPAPSAAPLPAPTPQRPPEPTPTSSALVADRTVWKLTVPITHDGENIRRELKKLCLDRGVTVEQFARDAINAHLQALGIAHITVR